MDKQPERNGDELIDAILKEFGERMGRGDGRLVAALREAYNPIPQPEPERRAAPEFRYFGIGLFACLLVLLCMVAVLVQ